MPGLLVRCHLAPAAAGGEEAWLIIHTSWSVSGGREEPEAGDVSLSALSGWVTESGVEGAALETPQALWLALSGGLPPIWDTRLNEAEASQLRETTGGLSVSEHFQVCCLESQTVILTHLQSHMQLILAGTENPCSPTLATKELEQDHCWQLPRQAVGGWIAIPREVDLLCSSRRE